MYNNPTGFLLQYAYMVLPDKKQIYEELRPQVCALLETETDAVANMANLAAALYHGLPGLNWAGFYVLKGRELVLGPFQGRPACVRIGAGKGVCGAAAERKETLVVDNVHEFPGHIACDAASKSEIVVPVLKNGAVWGVLDIDSPLPARFDDTDRRYLEQIAAQFVRCSDL